MNLKTTLLAFGLSLSLIACGDDSQNPNCDFDVQSIVNIKQDGIPISYWNCDFGEGMIQMMLSHDGTGLMTSQQEDYSLKWRETACRTIEYQGFDNGVEIFKSVASHLNLGDGLLSFTDTSEGDSVTVVCHLVEE